MFPQNRVLIQKNIPEKQSLSLKKKKKKRMQS